MGNEFSTRKRLNSFGYAVKGFAYVIKTQHNIWIDLFLAVIAILMGFLFDINVNEWTAIIIVISMVLAAETFNTAIELIVDKISPERNQVAGTIKDVAAWAVLTTAIVALVTGIVIFLPKLIELL